MSLPVMGAFVLRALLTELVEFGFECGDAAVAFAAASAGRTSGSHEGHLDSGSGSVGQGRLGDARSEVHLHHSEADKGKGTIQDIARRRCNSTRR
jgi:hypothetical protein